MQRPEGIADSFAPDSRHNSCHSGSCGNDTVSAVMQFDSRSAAPIDARVLGGTGNDDLTLDIYGIGDPDFLTALIDGGAGIDTAHHTDNVRVVNCER